MKKGMGTMRYANGDVYEGEWAEDVKSGFGHMFWNSSQQEYEGQWLRNMPNGVGKHTWFQQVPGGEASIGANHALLLMCNR